MSDEEGDKPKSALNADDLFDDDESDDDEEMAETTPVPAAATPTPANASEEDKDANTGADADADADETGGEKVMGENETENNDTKPATDNTALFGSDDDDEDDVEFNDDDNIVGKNRVVDPQEEALQQQQMQQQQQQQQLDDEHDETQVGASMTSTTNQISSQPVKPKKVIIKKQDLVVPDMPLPQFSNASSNANGKKSFHITSLPKIVAIQPAPFSKESYSASIEEAEYKSRVHSMIRWRYKTSKNGGDGNASHNEEKKERDPETGKLIKESNASIIKWSDGSFGLRVGNEMFDMDEFSFLLNAKKSNKMNKFKNEQQQQHQQHPINGPTSKDFLYLTQTASIVPSASQSSSPDPSTITVLQAVKTLRSKFIPRPSSLHSAAHKQFALESKSRTLQRAKIKTHVSFIDPEKQKQERIRHKDDLMKQESRSGGATRRSYGTTPRRRYNRGYDDDDDGMYDSVNIRRLKKGTMMDEDDMAYGDDDMQSDDEDEWSKRKKKGFESQRKKTSSRKRGRFEFDEESEDEEEEFDDDDDDDEGISMRKKASVGNKRKAAVFDDDDDSE